MSDTANDAYDSVTWWWTPDCGYFHVETDPVSVDLFHCPVHLTRPGDTK